MQDPERSLDAGTGSVARLLPNHRRGMREMTIDDYGNLERATPRRCWAELLTSQTLQSEPRGKFALKSVRVTDLESNGPAPSRLLQLRLQPWEGRLVSIS